MAAGSYPSPTFAALTINGAGSFGSLSTSGTATFGGTASFAGLVTASAGLAVSGTATFNNSVGIGTTTPRTALDTGTGTLSGAANDYLKGQFAFSGGGTVTWGGPGGYLKWTARFIIIPVGYSAAGSGYVDIIQPSANIPASQVYNNTARTANSNGIVLNSWEALWAVHTPGSGNSAVTYYITIYNTSFNAPSNWILVASVNGDDNSVKLGSGQILANGGTYTAGTGVSGSLDTAFGSIQGSILYRGSSGWAALGPGSSGQVLQSGGSSSNPSWANMAVANTNSGTVTSVGLSLPSLFTVSGSPVTSSGTLTGALATQAPNTVLAGPASGTANAAPTMRALVSADLPATTQVVDTNTSSGDFSANGSYINVLSVAFTATGTKAHLTGALTVNHGNSTTTPFYAYCDLYDNTAGSLVGQGKGMAMNLNSGTIAQGSISPVYGVSGLTPGHAYVCRLWIQRATANGSSPYTVELVGANL